MKYNKIKNICIFASLFIFSSCLYALVNAPMPEKLPDTIIKVKKIQWHKKLSSAQTIALNEYKPMIIFFSSRGCPWSRKLEDQVFTDPLVNQALSNFVPVHLDLDNDWETANRYGIYTVPTLLFISSDMSAIGRINGFVNAKQLSVYLNSLTTSNSNVKEQKVNILKRRLEQKKMTQEDWEELLTALGWELSYRRQLKEAVFAMKKFPAEKLVEFLTHKQLAIRTGAIELLEEYQGDNFGYDPWFEGSLTVKDLEALARWRKLVKGGKLKKQNTAVLTRERYNILLSRVLSHKRAVSNRATFSLKNGGDAALIATLDFLKAHPSLARGQRMKLKELEYAIIFTQLGMRRTLALAHQLIYGNLDTKARGLSHLGQSGAETMRVIRDFLNDPESILRETAVDALVAVANKKCVKYLEKHLKKEKNTDVIFCILKNMGKVKSVKSAKVLLKYLKDPNEDLNIIALQSLAEIRATKYSKDIIASLKNPHWRVKIATLETIVKLNLKCPKQIEQLLNSKDEFVRIKAIEALALQKKYNPGKKLNELYFKDDSLKGAVVMAYMSLERALPDSFIKALEGKDINTLSQIVSNLSISKKTGFNMAKFLALHPNDDIACQAVTLIANSNRFPFKNRVAFMNKILAADNPKKVLALVKNLEIDEKELKKIKYNSSTNIPKNGATEKDSTMDDLLDAFSDSPAKKTEKKIEINDLFNLFGAGDAVKTESLAEFADAIPRFAELIEKQLKQSKDKDIAFYSALVLGMLSKPGSIDYLIKVFDSQPAKKKKHILYCFMRAEIFTDKTRQLAKKAFHDKNDEVVKRAIDFMLEKKNKGALKDIMSFFANSKKRKIYDYYTYSFNSVLSSKAMQKWARDILKKKKLNRSIKIFAIAMLGQKKNEKNRLLLMKFIGSKNVWVKRAAFYSYGRIDFQAFEKIAKRLAFNKKENIRIIVPILARRHLESGFGAGDIIYFDTKHTISINSYNYYNRENKYISKRFIAMLRKLTNDISPRVSFEAFLALMNAGEDIDPRKMLITLKKIQDRTAVDKAVSKYVGDNYLFMDKKFKILLPYVKESEFYGTKYNSIMQYFSSKTTKKIKRVAQIEKIKIRSSKKSIKAERKVINKENNITLVFFYKTGCSECEIVERYFEIIIKSYPEIILKRKDLSTISAMRLNETYCDKFDVPSNYRLVAPAIFAGNGYLIKNNISFDKLGQLIADSNKVKDENWHIASTQDIEKSEKRIETRYGKIRTAIIFSAGFLDGINPCAFATIIFFISYMLLAHKGKKEILQVSIAFILGVFIAYYLMGLGMTEFITRFSLVQVLGRWFNWLIMAMALVMMILSLYDAILCLKGKIEDIKLQLPEFLKERIHRSIREGSKKYHFITAAFVTGVIISFLELACTGQVYAPTILFMLKTSTQSFQAYYLLLIYNLAFILPLIIIFLFTYLGIKNTTLIKAFKKNVALVKFGTALLFLIILIILLMQQ